MYAEKLKQLLRNFTFTPMAIMKVLAILFGGIIVTAVAIAILGIALRIGFNIPSGSGYSYGTDEYAMKLSSDTDFAGRVMNTVEAPMAKVMPSYDGAGGLGYSEQSIAMPAIVTGSANAEAWESTGYNASYETRQYKETQQAIENLKPLAYVVFLQANAGERSSYYNFNVETAHTQEVVDILRALNPKSWDESTVTVERGVEDAHNEIAILERKLASLNTTLTQAEQAFDSALAGARGVKDYTAIAQIVNNKVALVERLTSEKLAVQAQIDNYTTGLGRTTDEVEYAHFSVQLTKRTVVDWESLADMWRYRLEAFIGEVNNTLHALTFGVLMLVLTLVKWAIYLGIVAVALRLAWVIGRRFIHWAPWGL